MTASVWAPAGPFLIGLPAPGEEIRPEHEAATVILAPASTRDKPVQLHVPGYGLVTGLPCSRAGWMAFVGAVKAGRFDVEVPDDQSS